MGGDEAVETTNDGEGSLGDGAGGSRLKRDSDGGYVTATIRARLERGRCAAATGGRKLRAPEVEGRAKEGAIPERSKDDRGGPGSGGDSGYVKNSKLVDGGAVTTLVK